MNDCLTICFVDTSFRRWILDEGGFCKINARVLHELIRNKEAIGMHPTAWWLDAWYTNRFISVKRLFHWTNIADLQLERYYSLYICIHSTYLLVIQYKKSNYIAYYFPAMIIIAYYYILTIKIIWITITKMSLLLYVLSLGKCSLKEDSTTIAWRYKIYMKCRQYGCCLQTSKEVM